MTSGKEGSILMFFDQVFIKKAKGFLVFIVIYTALFVLFFSTLSYTGPFVFALLIALLTRPFTSFLRRKLKLPRGAAALVSTILVFAVLLLIVSAIFFKITVESKQLLLSLPSMDSVVKLIDGYISRLRVYYEQIDPVIIQKITEQISALTKNTLGIVMNIANWLISFAIGLPVIIMVVFVTLLATFFFSKDLVGMEIGFTSMFSAKGKDDVRAIWSEAGKMLAGYAKAYSAVVSLTFLESYIGFSVLNVKYALILSILCALLDVLPIIGISAVYLPLSAYFLITGRYILAVGVIILLMVITIIRQIIEPKLYSSTLDLHPAAVLAAIFIGIKAFGLLGMIYLLSVMVLYKILKKVNVL